MRQAFIMKLKPGALKEYVHNHDNIWPELKAALRECGIHQISTFADEPYLFLYSEIADEGAWDRIWSTDIHKKWAELMEPLMEIKDGKPDARFIKQIFHYEP